MPRLTLLQQKNRPIHRIYFKCSGGVAFTYCGVDPYRKGVRSENLQIGYKATCKDCLREEANTK